MLAIDPPREVLVGQSVTQVVQTAPDRPGREEEDPRRDQAQANRPVEIQVGFKGCKEKREDADQRAGGEQPFDDDDPSASDA